MQSPIDFTVDKNGIGVLCVNRPEVRNALNWSAQTQIANIAARLSSGQLPAVRVLIISGAGNRAFISGGDLKELVEDVTPNTSERLNETMAVALEQLTELPIPVIAAVNGDAFGGGCEIVTACDLVIAAESARFCFAHAKNGVTTAWGGAQRLVLLVGLGRALELLLTACVLTAEEAEALGLVQRVVPTGKSVLTAAKALALQLVALPSGALAGLKQLTRFAAGNGPESTALLEMELFSQLCGSPDHLEALAAFNEKRAPQFNRLVSK